MPVLYSYRSARMYTYYDTECLPTENQYFNTTLELDSSEPQSKKFNRLLVKLMNTDTD
jgi:hypothetical protein